MTNSIEQHRAPSITVGGVPFSWDENHAVFEVFGIPALASWVGTTLAGLMLGMQRMVGTERFNLSLLGGGRESIDGDWAVISASESFEQGFAALSDIAMTCGWGRWSLESLDREANRAVFRMVNSWEALYQRDLGVKWGSTFTAGKFAGICAKLFGVDCWATQTSFQAEGAEYDEIVISASAVSMEDRHNALLTTDKATRADLAVALRRLEAENAERERAEREAHERLELIETLSVSILQVWDGVLAAPILGSLSAERSTRLMERLLEALQRTGSSYAILDLTGVELVDSDTADHLLKIVRAAALLGARCIITGVQPAVARTMVDIQASFTNIVTRASLRDGIEYCIQADRSGSRKPRA